MTSDQAIDALNTPARHPRDATHAGHSEEISARGPRARAAGRRTLVALAALALLFASVGTAQAGRGGRHMGARLAELLDELAPELGVSRETLDAIHGIQDAARARRVSLDASLRDAKLELHDLLRSDTPSDSPADAAALEAAALAAVDRLGELRTESHKLAVQTLLAIRAHLTAEQRAALEERAHEHRRRRGVSDAPPADSSDDW